VIFIYLMSSWVKYNYKGFNTREHVGESSQMSEGVLIDQLKGYTRQKRLGTTDLYNINIYEYNLYNIKLCRIYNLYNINIYNLYNNVY